MRRNVAASGESDVGMERAQIWFEANGEDRFLDPFMELKEMRMTGADTDPDNFWSAFAGESSKPDERQEEGFPGNGAKFFAKFFPGLSRNASEEAES